MLAMLNNADELSADMQGDQPNGDSDQDGSDESLDNAASGRIGKAVEYLVAASCILSSRGQLNVSTSLVDDEGVDLVFFRRGVPTTLAVQVKARTTRASLVRNRSQFVAQVRDATFAARRDLDMLFVLVDPDQGRQVATWLVPSTEFAQLAPARANGKRRFSASVKPTSKDQWSGYRLAPAELASAVLERLATLDA